MIITITIDTANAAFADDEREVQRILEVLAREYAYDRVYHDGRDIAHEGEWPILDWNGNACGTVKHTKE